MSTKSQRRLGSASLLLIALAFIAAVIISNQLFKGARVDLTESKLYTLSDGTRNIVDSLDEPINLYFYFSDQASASVPSIRDYAKRVREMLEEIEDAAHGNIRLSVIDPQPFSEDEDRAAQFGLQAVSLGGVGDPVYLGLAGTDSVDNEEVISFFQPDKEAFLEYDIVKLISALANPDRTIIGLVTGMPLSGNYDPQTQQMLPPWAVYEQANQLFQVRSLGTSFDRVDDEISLLWIVQPRGLDNLTLYAIDQFIMRGGKAMIFVDPLAESDPAPAAQGMPPGMPPMAQGSDLPVLFDAWGIGYSTDDVVGDAQLALQITSGRSPQPIRHFGFLGITSEQLDPEDVVTADLNSINVGTTGHFTLAENAPATLVPLITSSEYAALIPATRFSFLPDPASLQDGFTPAGEAYILAARVSGTLPSAFPGGPPESSVSSADGDEQESGVDDSPEGHLSETVEPANLIVVADVDMLGDRMWVQIQNFFGQQIANAFASNGAFVINGLDSLSGSSDLIGVRSRETYSRPFTRVESLRVDAENQFRETEQRLQSELAETERRLGELQSSREDDGNILLTNEQRDEIDRFIDQRSAIRKELRSVQRGLDKDIEQLGTRLKVINIGLVPLLLTVFVLFALWRRGRGEDS